MAAVGGYHPLTAAEHFACLRQALGNSLKVARAIVGNRRGEEPHPVSSSSQLRLLAGSGVFLEGRNRISGRDWEQRIGVMPRFILNRWWTFILVLVTSTAGVASLSRTSLADSGDLGGKGVGDSGGGDITPTPGPDPQGAGDPDSPSGSGKTSSTRIGGSPTYGRVGPLGAAGVGDASATGTARIWLRVRFAMGMLKYYYLRF
jgi:hypothetical protein